jgi:hypothetical protein
MPLNPEFASQSTRILPFCLGWNYLQGVNVNSIFGLSNINAAVQAYFNSISGGATLTQIPSEVAMYVLGDGEFDSFFMASFLPGQAYTPTDTLVGGQELFLNRTFRTGLTTYPPSNANRLLWAHFHGGAFSTIGLPNNLVSWGPDQATDSFMNYLPAVTPILPYSGMAYVMVRATSTSGQSETLSPYAIYRTTRCRLFDANGNVTNYGFTTNPAWQIVETLLRFWIKPQQPALAGLLSAEQAMFDWPSIVAFAERCAAVQADGNPLFAGNFAFAADAALDAMMEAQLRNCCAFRRNRGGKISFVGEESKTSVFTFSQNNIVGGSLKLNKKDLRNAPNVYVPQFRDLNLPAIVEVQSITTTGAAVDNAGNFSSGPTSIFTTVGPQPFAPTDLAVYGGSSNDGVFAGLYGGNGANPIDLDGVVQDVISTIPNQFPVVGGPVAGGTATGGYLGSYSTYFKQRAPEVVQHRAHQKAVAQVGPGITPVARQNKVFYDLGNNTFNQTNRTMQFMVLRDLGTDGPNWLAPFVGSIAGPLEALDVNGAALAEVEPGDLVTIDSTASAEFGVGSAKNLAGLYEVVDPMRTFYPSADKSNSSRRELSLQTYNPAANPVTIVPAAPGASFASIPGFCLSLADVMPSTTPFWLLQATPEATYSGSTLTVTIPDCTIQWLGQAAPTVYPAITLAGIPIGTLLTLYLVVTNIGTTPTILLDTTSPFPGYPAGATLAQLSAPPTLLPAGRIVLYFGEFTPAGEFGGQAVSGSAIPSGSSAEVALPSGASSSSAVVYTPSAGFAGQACFYGYDPSLYVPASGSTSYSGTPGYPTPTGPITESPG